MATNTYVALSTQTVGTATPSITFTNINQSYTDLVLVSSILPSASTNQPYIQFNADTGLSTTNYSTTSIRGDGGGTPASSRHTNQIGWFPVPGPGLGTNGNPEPWTIQIFNYTNTTTSKSGLSRFNNAVSILSGNSHLWRATPQAITSITITMEAGNFNSGSTFSLYGVATEAVTPAAKATGGSIYDDASYYYHVFGSTGVFTPSQSISADILVVAGGGAAAIGGGGAGGLLSFSSQSLTATNYAVTVGAGGAAQTNNVNSASQGTGSQFGGLTATVGGGAGGLNDNNTVPSTLLNGGSGGGSGGAGGGFAPNGTATSGQGNNGGNYGGFTSSPFPGGGGGGAGAVGGNATANNIAGNGGIGATSSLINAIGLATGTGQYNPSNGNYYFAGGGGGGGNGLGIFGTGGFGGGGNASNVPVANAPANMGGGGGGYNGGLNKGANGGSGIVVIRYLKA